MFDFENIAKEITSAIIEVGSSGLTPSEVAEKSSVLGKVVEVINGMTVYQSPLGEYEVAVVSVMSSWSDVVSKSGGAICTKLDDGRELVVFHSNLVRALRSDEMAALYLHETGHLKNGDLNQGGHHDEKRADDVALVAYTGKTLFSAVVKAIDHCSMANGFGKTGIYAMRAVGVVCGIHRVVNMLCFWSKTKWA